MPTAPAVSGSRATDTRAAPPQFHLVVRREVGGPVLARRTLTDVDLGDLLAEARYHLLLRRGLGEPGPDNLDVTLTPRFSASGGPLCDGFDAEVVTRSDETVGRPFPVETFLESASAMAEDLSRQGVIAVEDSYTFELQAHPPAAPGAEDGLPPGIVLQDKSPAMETVVSPVPLRVLLQSACAVGPPDDPADAPVLFTESALARAEAFSRRGAAENPPVESGAMLLGMLARCPESNDLFPVVTGALEARDAETHTYSLTFTGPTWARFQAVLRALRSRPETRALRLIGEAHGHNFLPGEGVEPCPDCALREVCSRTSAVLSMADRAWHRAVFCRQPWNLGLIFGLDAMGRPVHTAYGVRHGRLVARNYHVVPGFGPGET
jgi:hypothetical protein